MDGLDSVFKNRKVYVSLTCENRRNHIAMLENFGATIATVPHGDILVCADNKEDVSVYSAPVVSTAWIAESAKAGQMLPIENFHIKSTVASQAVAKPFHAEEDNHGGGKRSHYTHRDEVRMAEWVVRNEGMRNPGSETFWKDLSAIVGHSMQSLHSHWKRLSNASKNTLITQARANVSTDARPLTGHLSVLEKMRAGSAAAVAVSSSFRQTPAATTTTTATTTTSTASTNASGQSISSLNYSPSRASIRKRAIMSNPSTAMLQHNAAQQVEDIEDVDDVPAQPTVEKRARTNTLMSETQADLDALIAESQADDFDVAEVPSTYVLPAPVSATTALAAPAAPIAVDALPPPASWSQRDSWVDLTTITSAQFKSQLECSRWAFNELKKHTQSSPALAAWALMVHSGIYSRALKHLQLMLPAANSNSLDGLSEDQVKELIMIDSLAWTTAEDDILFGSSLDIKPNPDMAALMQRRGAAEVLRRMRFITEEVEVRSEPSDRRVIFA